MKSAAGKTSPERSGANTPRTPGAPPDDGAPGDDTPVDLSTLSDAALAELSALPEWRAAMPASETKPQAEAGLNSSPDPHDERNLSRKHPAAARLRRDLSGYRPGPNSDPEHQSGRRYKLAFRSRSPAPADNHAPGSPERTGAAQPAGLRATVRSRLLPDTFPHRLLPYLGRLCQRARQAADRVSVPPQHGKSLGSSVLLPAYALGIRPGLRIALASYNLRLASRFNRRIQQLIDSAPYAELFPDTRLKPLHGGTGNKKEAAAPSAAGAGNLVRTAEEFDLAGQSGGLLAVGREGSLTGNTVDLLILDDLFKDTLEANSPLVRDNAWEWYNAVARTRLHNGSQELIVGTRWHEEDLPGRIAAHERVVGLTDFSRLGTLPPDCWLMLNFEAIKESPPTPADPRDKGEALWPARHSRALLDARRRLDPHLFEALYQGRPAWNCFTAKGSPPTTNCPRRWSNAATTPTPPIRATTTSARSATRWAATA